jgi:hypothetical protein
MKVEVATNGMPVQVEWQGRVYRVIADPVRWYERRRWWEEEMHVGGGEGAGIIDHEIWRLQVQLSPGSPIRTFDVSHRVGTDLWRMICVHSEFTMPVTRPLRAG